MSMDREQLSALKDSFWKEPVKEAAPVAKPAPAAEATPAPVAPPAAPVVETKINELKCKHCGASRPIEKWTPIGPAGKDELGCPACGGSNCISPEEAKDTVALMKASKKK